MDEHHLQSKEVSKQNIEWFTKFLEYCELEGIHGETVEFGWTLSPGHKTLQLLREIPRTMTENRIQPEQFGDRAIFMSMYFDIDWTNAEHEENDISFSFEAKAYARKLHKAHQPFFGPGTEEICDGQYIYKPNGLWKGSAEMMMLYYSEHQKFSGTGALD